MAHKTELAQRALWDLRRSGTNLPDDDLEKAEYFVDKGKQYLDRNFSWDVDIHDPGAEEAIIEFVKVKMAGQTPHASEAFIAAAEAWAREQAMEYHQGAQEAHRFIDTDSPRPLNE